MKKLVLLAGLLLCGLLVAGPAMAAFTDTFTGGGAVTSGTDPLGDTWVTGVFPQDVTTTPIVIWGIPGYGLGDAFPSFSGTLTDFHFSTVAEPGTGDRYKILQTTQTVDGTTTETRFDNETKNALWTPVFSADGFSVDFFSPNTADNIISGESFFVNIAFAPPPSVTGLSLDDLYFTAHFTGTTGVPEPATLLLLGFGLFGVGFAGRKIKK